MYFSANFSILIFGLYYRAKNGWVRLIFCEIWYAIRDLIFPLEKWGIFLSRHAQPEEKPGPDVHVWTDGLTQKSRPANKLATF